MLNIKSSVEEFSKSVEDFNDRQRSMSESLNWIQEYKENIDKITASINMIRDNTNEIVLTQGENEISDIAGNESRGSEIEDGIALSVEQKYVNMYETWSELTKILQDKIGPENFDGRAVGAIAWRLSHGKRVDPISKEDAELIAKLHSQFKRFGRLKSTMEAWLTDELYRNFLHGVESVKRNLT